MDGAIVTTVNDLEEEGGKTTKTCTCSVCVKNVSRQLETLHHYDMMELHHYDMMELTQTNTCVQASDLHVTTASQDSKSMLQQEIEVLGDKVLEISGGDIQSPTTEEETVLKDGQVLGLINEGDPSPAVHTEHYAPDPSLKCLKTSSSQNSPTHMTSISSQFSQYLSGGEDNSSAFIVDNMISEEKSHLAQHSVEDLIHAEILMSLKTGLTAGETELSSDMDEILPELPSHQREKSNCEDLNNKQSTDVEGTGVTEDGSNALSDIQERKRMAMCRALEYVLADLREMYEASPSLYPYHRVISGRTYTRDVYLSARSDSGLTPYKCGICGKKCAGCGSLCHHVKSPKTPLLYKCDVCGKEFQHSSSLKFHMKMHKTEDASTARYSNTGRDTFYSESSFEKSIYECEVCGKRLQQGDEFKNHLQSHQSRTCKICMKEFSNLSYHMRQHLENKMSRIRHRTRKETDKFTQNDHFSSPQYISVSTNTYQNCFGRLQCPSCPKSFPSRHQLQVHVVYHSEPRFKCHTCDQEFYHKYQLQLHQISHTGLPRHMCRRCNQSFSFSFSLRMHMRIHTSIRLLRRMVKPFV